MVGGKLKKHKRCGKYVPTIQTLSEDDWNTIWNLVKFWETEKKTTGDSSRASSMDADRESIESDEDEHFVLKPRVVPAAASED